MLGQANRKEGIRSIRPEKKMATSDKSVTADERRQMVEQAAYFLAEKRGFEAGHELEDWLSAERQIESRLGRCQK
ncbi:MAG: DUF2934 domain-containing protein [Deltaproteobacteria bacterium]|nr:DUF2934 domain-containing protein [Deltaproteobacteria bacterium]